MSSFVHLFCLSFRFLALPKCILTLPFLKEKGQSLMQIRNKRVLGQEPSRGTSHWMPSVFVNPINFAGVFSIC